MREFLVRAGVVIVVGLAIFAGCTMNVSGKLPSEALDSAFLLRVEHGFVVLLGLLVALVVLDKGLWDAQLPSEAGREGIAYPKEALKSAEDAAENLANLSNRRWQILRRVTIIHQDRLGQMEERLSKLENR